ncbi:MAG: hypothetical protein M5R40_14860 [Anaerolineae bacterium]|nr:hypothetical protein [Anaerolineae bacterium]
MDVELLIQHILAVVVPVGLPILVLVVLAVEVGAWHEAQPEVPDEVFREGDHH